jgi:aspartyl-tRNA(Asn)/glutamyl-tRNA(Gln) amidotransferase subunit A
VLSAGAVSDYYERGVIIRQKIRDDFDRVFQELGVDALLTPTTPTGPFPVNDKKTKSDPVAMYLNDVMTIPANLAGVPAISIPAATTRDGKYPLGLQLMSAREHEEKMLHVAQALESHADFMRVVPERVYHGKR